MLSNEQEIIQYKPFQSFVNPSFWHALTEIKLNVDKLSDSTKQIHGRFTFRDDIGTVFEVDSTSFNSSPGSENLYINITGTIMNKNTIEDFKSIDKAAFLNSVGEMIWASIKNKVWIDKPSSLLNFFILSFADLKKFHYYYWFAFPAPNQPVIHVTQKTSSITQHFSNKQIDKLSKSYKSLEIAQNSFFVVTKENDDINVLTLSKVFQAGRIKQTVLPFDLASMYFVFADPSDVSNPGWPLRLYLVAILEHCPFLAGAELNVIGLRWKMAFGVEGSQVFKVKLPKDASMDITGWVGWERNDKKNFGPRLANMAASMDPVKLADASSDLNIRLMKWRLVPDIDIDVMKKTKCLLLGAGTLGCHVARNLLAWGFRHITFIDNGKVSYSNPTRQVLFNHQDCLNGGRMKAEAAADNLRNILPSVVSRKRPEHPELIFADRINIRRGPIAMSDLFQATLGWIGQITKGLVAHIPMPGHPIGESVKEETINNINLITREIAEHDVTFLLLDTREARWLPTLIAAHYGKIAINAALGFDSYLVMRHGDGSSPCDVTLDKESLPGGQLGCYFCNDVTAPGNSVKDRTLDQQCTVTRPGVAAIAGALAVEILVGLLQHPLRIQAPAVYNLSDTDLPSSLQGVLGPIPHSIRGFLHSYQTVAPTCAKFKQCIACSDIVVGKYRTEGMEFLLNVFNSGNYLEDITGLTALHLAAELTDVMTFSDEDEE